MTRNHSAVGVRPLRDDRLAHLQQAEDSHVLHQLLNG